MVTLLPISVDQQWDLEIFAGLGKLNKMPRFRPGDGGRHGCRIIEDRFGEPIRLPVTLTSWNISKRKFRLLYISGYSVLISWTDENNCPSRSCSR